LTSPTVADVSPRHARLPAFATGPVVALACLTTALLLAVASRYGFHRDELYFLSASRHLDWGYVDQPPVAVLVAWLNRVAWGDTLVGLRVVPAVLMGLVVLLTGLVTRELGGSRFAQGFAAACVATSGLVVVGHLEGPTAFDVFTWALTSWLVVRILRTGDEHLWLAVGLVVGLGLEAKQTVLLLLGGLAVGFVVNRQWRLFASGWLWSGAALALAGWAPNLVWQASNGWPTLTMDANLRAEHSGLGYALKFPLIMLLSMGVVLAPVWLAGAWALWRDPQLRRFRAFAVAFGLAAALVWIVIPNRFYYVFGSFPVLFAAGAIVTDRVVDGTRGFFRSRPKHRWLWRSRRIAIGIVVVNFLLFLPLALPVLPESVVAAANLNKVNYNLGEEIGWPELVSQVAHVWHALPARERSHTVLLTSNYGEAGALVRYGGDHGLPAVYSGHNSFWWWGPPPDSATDVVAVGTTKRDLSPFFSDCRVAARVHNRPDVHNDERGAPVWTCTGRREGWSKIWPTLRHYD
jgi:Dolichyl-phosphate-mannose-protein mannosyltransferase